MIRVNSAYKKCEAGMTLLEVLVAMTIFSLIATAGYTALEQGISIQARLQQKRLFWSTLESGFNLIEKDLSQASNRAPRIAGLLKSVAFQGGNNSRSLPGGDLISFTRGGEVSFRENPASPYRRITYRLREGTLYRTVWPRLDMPYGESGNEVALMENIAEIKLGYLIGKNWVDNWNIDIYSVTSDELPKAVDFIITSDTHEFYRRIFHVGYPH